MAEKGVEKEENDQPNYQSLFQSAMKVTKASNELPNNGHDYEYYQSYQPFAGAMKHMSDRLVNIMTKMYAHYGLTGRMGRLDFEEQLELVSDNNDVLMERINNALDEAAGLKKQAETVVVEMKAASINGSWNRASSKTPTQSFKLLSAKNILRPQLKFKEKINNKPGPFIPKIKEKPHSLKPLAILLEINDFGDEEFSHPYEFELERFEPDPKFFEVVKQPTFQSVDETPLVLVSTADSFKKLLQDLSTQEVIGVDLEAHSYRTFQGITCLMQISTASTDYIVDTLELWDQLQPLNEIFCNPKIVKIFHGADSDVEWLQRDFGIYVVNMFDTYQAAKLLGFAQLSLAFLLRHYCQISIDKQFQLADWRIRPLPNEMIQYAREDTHYLNYIFQRLKQDLKVKSVNDNLLAAVWNNSRLTCLKRYRIPQITPDSHLELYRVSKKAFNERQLYALREIYAWRDAVARQEDESVHYVLPKHMMLQIADVMPREMQGILACCSPIPPLVRQHLLTLHEIILKARELSLSSLQNHGKPIPKPTPVLVEHDQDDPMYCVHDLTQQDIRDDLPTLLGSAQGKTLVSRAMDQSETVVVHVKKEPQTSIFAGTSVQSAHGAHVAFVSPYARYAKVKASEEAERAAERSRIENLKQHFIDTVAESQQAEPDIGNKDTAEAKKTSPTKRSISDDAKADVIALPKKKKLPLAAQIPRRKKKKTGEVAKTKPITEPVASTSSSQTDSGSTSTPKEMTKKQKKKLAKQKAEESAANFQPFDYSQIDYKAFKNSALRADAAQGNRGRGRGRGGGAKGSQRNVRIFRKGSTKSMTYANNK